MNLNNNFQLEPNCFMQGNKDEEAEKHKSPTNTNASFGLIQRQIAPYSKILIKLFLL